MKKSDTRFDDLLAKARAGDEHAIHDLFAEFGYDANTEPRAPISSPDESETKKPSLEQ